MYAVIINKEAIYQHKDYEEAKKNSKGGIVIRSQDVEKYGYTWNLN